MRRHLGRFVPISSAVCFLLVVCCFGVFGLGDNGESSSRSRGEPGRAMLEKRRCELRLELLKQRARLLKEDPRIAEINHRIEMLYLELDREMSRRTIISDLRSELERVESRLREKTD